MLLRPKADVPPVVLQIETEGEHLLVDSKNEKKFGLSLAVVVDRAAKHRDRGGLLAGKSFWWTPKVMGDLDQIKKLVESAGGTVSRASLFTLAFLVSGRGADMQSSELIMAGEQITKGFPKASLITESRDSRFLISDVADIDKWRPVRICPRLPSLAPKLLQLTSFFFSALFVRITARGQGRQGVRPRADPLRASPPEGQSLHRPTPHRFPVLILTVCPVHCLL